MPFNLFGTDADLQTIVRERRKDAATVKMLEDGKLPGRIRTGLRAVPSGNADVIAGDALGDVVTNGTYVYTLISVSGALKWDRRAHSVGW